MTEINIDTKYREKAKDSFKTKLNLYVFEKHITESKDKIGLEDFQNFIITDDLVLIYTSKYWNWYPDVEFCSIPSSVDLSKYTKLTSNELQKAMKNWRENNTFLIEKFEKDYVANFGKVFPKYEFSELFNMHKCEYCEITIPEINDLVDKEQLFNKQYSRGFTFEIDRINSNKEYTKDNCVICCYWCNNAKTDEFNREEFKIIGKAIREVWLNRLKKPSII